MTLDRQPLERVALLAGRNASGELICASDSVEVHVYFQHGRLAWATDSARPLAFTRHLLETAQVDVGIFREILESCRREKRPLGETLIAWGVATREEVRDALRHQIDLALTLLRDSGPVQMLFLNRASQFADYDAELTFGLDELLLRSPSDRPPPRPSVPVRAARDPSALPSAAMRLRASLDGVAWVETLDEATLVESIPGPTTTSRVPSALVRGTLLDGAELVALRMSSTTLAGVALSPTQSLWCLVTAGITVGAIVATLAALVPDDERPSPSKTFAGTGAPWAVGSGGARATATLREFVERAPEVYAAFVTDPADPQATYGGGRAPVRAFDVLSIVNRRACALTAPDVLDDAAPPADVDADGLSSRRAMTAERSFCLFAGEVVSDGKPRFVWLVLDRRCSKGLGWGYLTSLSRELVRVFREEQP